MPLNAKKQLLCQLLHGVMKSNLLSVKHINYKCFKINMERYYARVKEDSGIYRKCLNENSNTQCSSHSRLPIKEAMRDFTGWRETN